MTDRYHWLEGSPTRFEDTHIYARLKQTGRLRDYQDIENSSNYESVAFLIARIRYQSSQMKHWVLYQNVPSRFGRVNYCCSRAFLGLCDWLCLPNSVKTPYFRFIENGRVIAQNYTERHLQTPPARFSFPGDYDYDSFRIEYLHSSSIAYGAFQLYVHEFLTWCVYRAPVTSRCWDIMGISFAHDSIWHATHKTSFFHDKWNSRREEAGLPPV